MMPVSEVIGGAIAAAILALASLAYWSTAAIGVGLHGTIGAPLALFAPIWVLMFVSARWRHGF